MSSRTERSTPKGMKLKTTFKFGSARLNRVKTETAVTTDRYTNQVQNLYAKGRTNRNVIKRPEPFIVTDGIYGQCCPLLNDKSLRRELDSWLTGLVSDFGRTRGLCHVDIIDAHIDGSHALDIRVGESYEVSFPNNTHTFIVDSPLAKYLQTILPHLESFYQSTESAMETSFKGRNLQIFFKGQLSKFNSRPHMGAYHVDGEHNEAVMFSANYCVRQENCSSVVSMQNIETGETLPQRAVSADQLWVVKNDAVLHKVDKPTTQSGESLTFSVWLVDPNHSLPSLTTESVESAFPAQDLLRANCKRLLSASLFSDGEEEEAIETKQTRA